MERDDVLSFLSTKETAVLFGVSVGSVQKWVDQGILEGWRTEGGHRRISIASIHDYQRKRNMQVDAVNLHELRKPANSKLRVLVVDDDAVTREMIHELCGRAGEMVDCFALSSGMEALLDIASINPDILITDLDMPGICGFGLLRHLRLKPQFSRMMAVVLTSLTPEDIETKGGLPKDVILMTKPINLEWLGVFLSAYRAGRGTELGFERRSV